MHPSTNSKSRKPLVIGAALVAAVLAAGGVLWAGDKPVLKGLPDLLGTQRALPPGAVQVEDLAADMSNFKGTITVRGVMAAPSPDDATLFSMIDSREARVCSDLHCAKTYLPVRMNGTRPKPWDELNVRGKISEDKKRGFLFVQADSVENLGSIK